jgi:hypothetical protein
MIKIQSDVYGFFFSGVKKGWKLRPGFVKYTKKKVNVFLKWQMIRQVSRDSQEHNGDLLGH